MQSVEIYLTSHKSKYSIKIGDNIIFKIPEMIDLSTYSSIYVITDSNVSSHYLSDVKDVFSHSFHRSQIASYIFEAGEKNKQLQTVESIYNDMVEKKIDRKALIVNLGGGVVTDLGGFVASTFLRGVSCLNISTTLEGMVDASVGGKTGVNLDHLKNYIGSFAQPALVVADINTLKTLPHRVFIQGYAEVIKHGLIADKKYFEEVIKGKPEELQRNKLIEVIARSVEIKAQIVQSDEKELAARKLLNFGHTIGHVIESISMQSDKPLFHGEAVSIGMIAEAYISRSTGMIEDEEFNQIENGIRNVGLPVRFETKVTVDEILNKLLTDKKVQSGSIKWSLLLGIGIGEFNVSVDDKFVKEAISYILTIK